MCCSSPEPPAAPDISKQTDFLIALGERAKEIGNEVLEFAQDQFEGQSETLQQILDIQIPIVGKLFEAFEKGTARFEDLFQPLEDDLIQDAVTFDTAEKRELEAGRASARVRKAGDQAQAAAAQELAGYGIDPSTLRAGAIDAQLKVANAADQAAAANIARQEVENTSRELRAQAIDVGTNTVNRANTTAINSANIGNAVVGNTNATAGAGVANQVAVAPFFNAAGTAVANSASLQNQNFQGELASFNSQDNSSFLGTALGIGASFAGSYYGVPTGADGGAIPDGTGPPNGDTIEARVSPNEFIVPADVVLRKGTEFMEKLVVKTRENAVQEQQVVPNVPPNQLPPATAAIPAGAI